MSAHRNLSSLRYTTFDLTSYNPRLKNSMTESGNGSESEYVLPIPIKMITDAAISQATAVGIVMALFAGALTSFAQTVANGLDTDVSPASWKALRGFLYCAIMLNLSGSFLSLIIIKMCSDLPLAMYQYNKRSIDPSPGPKSLYTLMEEVGMSKTYRYVNFMAIIMLVLACISTFAALTFWVSLSETIIPAGITVGIFGILSIGVIFSAVVAFRSQSWF